VFAYSVHGCFIDVTGDNAITWDNSISNHGNDTEGDGINLTGTRATSHRDNNISSPYGTRATGGSTAGSRLTGNRRGTRCF